MTALECSCQHIFFINFIFFLSQECFPWRPRGKHRTQLGKSSLVYAGSLPRIPELSEFDGATAPNQVLSYKCILMETSLQIIYYYSDELLYRLYVISSVDYKTDVVS